MTRVLIVEDEPINLELLAEVLQQEGYDTVRATDGGEAWEALSRSPQGFDAVLLDRLMPDIDGIEILRRMKTEPAMLHTPVIMQTSMAGDEAVAEGLEAGAYYYLTKPFAADTLLAIVAAAVRDRREYLELMREVRQATRSIACLDSAEFTFRTPDEARDIATLLAQTAPDPGRTVLGLSELMLNAVEHGNLAITYDEKSALLRDDRLAEEITARLAGESYGQRRVRVSFSRAEGEIHYRIRDEGAGFNWRNYLEMSPERAFDVHGRGIAMSRLVSFDRLEYNDRGNEVRASVATPRKQTS